MQSGTTCWLTHAESSSKALTLRKFRQKLRTESLSQQVGLGFGGLDPFGRSWIDLFGLHRSYRIETFEIFIDPGCGWMIIETLIPGGICSIHPGLRNSQWQTAQSWTGTPSATGPWVATRDVFLTRCCVGDLGCVPDS